jgi:hypothetical protein
LFRGLGFQFWQPPIAPVLGRVERDGPASRAGLASGDRIVAIDGVRMSDFREIADYVNARPNQRINVEYLRAGTWHIWSGIDHLLFVFGLLLIVQDRWMLLKTVTSFTLAHSLTLAIATLGYASAPMLPLNAAIALSILFLGPEIVRSWRGETSLTLRHPWLVAFVFGLLHGFGFASALAGAGLPRRDLPLALCTFNVGVEVGQMAFVGLAGAFAGTVATRWHWDTALILVAAGVLGALATVAVGMPTLRARGLAFAVMTLAPSMIAPAAS